MTDYENNLHIDDVNITSVPATFTQQISSEEGFDIFPNPTTDQVFINLQLSTEQSADISISNSIGQVVYNNEFSGITNSTLQVDLQNFAAGIYYVTLRSDKLTITKRLLLKK